ncbi:hypothetical protein Tco_0015355 [Tanacetum coccineum]
MVNGRIMRRNTRLVRLRRYIGMMAGLHADNGGADVSDATAEFAMMGISPKLKHLRILIGLIAMQEREATVLIPTSIGNLYLYDGKTRNRDKLDLEEQRDAEGIVVGIKQRLLDVKRPFSMGDNSKKKCMSLSLKALRFLTSKKHVDEWFKALYGLHQALVLVGKIVCFSVTTQLQKKCTIDSDTVHQGKIQGLLLVQVYVDESIFGSTITSLCDEFEVLMKGEFERVLWEDVFSSEVYRTATTPYEAAKTKLKDETDPPVNVHLYRSMIGSLMYLTASRPDIMFAVIRCYSDSDYAGSHGDRKSTTGGCQFLGRRLISWQCKKQTIVATSSTEAEYVAAVAVTVHSTWDSEPVAGSQYAVGVHSSADRMVSACLILPAGCFVSAGSYGLCCWFRVHAGGHTSAGGFISVKGFVYAANTSIHAAGLGCAGSIMFLLADLFLCLHGFCCCMTLSAG